MKLAKVALAVLILLSLLMLPQSARADVAPPSQPSGSNVVPGEVTMVQMVYERVVIDLRPPWADGNNADVTAKFVMQNQGTVDEQMAVGFPLNNILNVAEGPTPRLKNLTVNINGNGVTYQTTSENIWLTNKDQETYGLDWAVFDVVFPVGKDVIIELNYKQPPTYDAPTTQYDYTLFTGAGWYGPIGAGDIIFRLPYTISYWENYWSDDNENNWGGITTEMIVENEARWHFENFEPENHFHDNWTVRVIRPTDWERILTARKAVANNQYDAKLWMELGDAYSNAALELGGKTYHSSYQAITAYEQSVALKPDWAEAHACLAREYFKAYHDEEFYAMEENPPDENLRYGALHELSIALALDPTNEKALDLQEELKAWGAGWELPPPTPYATPFIKSTSIPTPTVTSVIVTVVHTQIVNSPTLITPATSTSTQMAVQGQHRNGISMPLMIFGVLLIFAAGLGAGLFWQKRTGK